MHALNKGKGGEREACYWLSSILGEEFDIKRALGQARDSGADILSIPGLVIEVKRQETLNLNGWWWQVCRAADAKGDVPVLMYRQNKRKWRFCIPGYLLLVGMPGRIELEEAEFAYWLRHWVAGPGNV